MLIFWLINALVCFHPVLADDGCVHPQCNGTELSHSDNTLFDVFCNHFPAQKKHTDQTHHKSTAKARYAISRTGGLHLLSLAPLTILFTPHNPMKVLNFSAFNYWVNRVFLPPHHNFLFRLSPF